MMTNQEIFDMQQKQRQFNETELGNLFNRFVDLHARAWHLDGNGHGLKECDKAWAKLEPVERELRQRLMEIAGVK
jgi:hypothetical protein